MTTHSDIRHITVALPAVVGRVFGCGRGRDARLAVDMVFLWSKSQFRMVAEVAAVTVTGRPQWTLSRRTWISNVSPVRVAVKPEGTTSSQITRVTPFWILTSWPSSAMPLPLLSLDDGTTR
jgi:hypothetical protein